MVLRAGSLLHFHSNGIFVQIGFIPFVHSSTSWFSPFPSIHFVRSREHDQILQYYHQHDNRYFCHMSIFLSPLFPYFAITIFPCKRVLFEIHLGRCNVALQMTSALQPVPLCWERCHFSKTLSMTRKIWLLFQSSPQ